MFSISKKSFLLPIIILFTARATQCSEYNITGGTITFQSDDTKRKNSALWEIGKLLLPVAGGALVNYALQKWNEDPEVTAMSKEEKKADLAIKQHSDYPGIEMQRRKNEVTEKELTLKQKDLELDATRASIIQHHQEKWAEYKKCNPPFTCDFCSDMIIIHQQELSKFIKQTQNNGRS